MNEIIIRNNLLRCCNNFIPVEFLGLNRENNFVFLKKKQVLIKNYKHSAIFYNDYHQLIASVGSSYPSFSYLKNTCLGILRDYWDDKRFEKDIIGMYKTTYIKGRHYNQELPGFVFFTTLDEIKLYNKQMELRALALEVVDILRESTSNISILLPVYKNSNGEQVLVKSRTTVLETLVSLATTSELKCYLGCNPIFTKTYIYKSLRRFLTNVYNPRRAIKIKGTVIINNLDLFENKKLFNMKQIKLSDIIDDLNSGYTKTNSEKLYNPEIGSIQEKYGLTDKEVKYLFKHPKLKGVKTKEVLLEIIDDTEPQLERNEISEERDVVSETAEPNYETDTNVIVEETVSSNVTVERTMSSEETVTSDVQH